MSTDIRTFNQGWTTLVWDSTSEVFIPDSDFVLIQGWTKGRGWTEMRGRWGNILASPAVQMANDPRAPDTTATQIKISGGDTGYGNANGVFDPDSVLATIATDGKRYIRTGWLIKLSSAGTGGCVVVGTIQLYKV